MSQVEKVRNYEIPETAHDVLDEGSAHGIAFFIAGITIGAGLALLMAPATGEDVRYVLRRGYRKTVKGLGRRTRDLRERAEDLFEHAQDLRDQASDLRDRGSKLLRFARRR